MSHEDRAKALSDILASYGDVWTFTESQEASEGDLIDDAEVDRRLRDVVARMRRRYEFATPLDDAALAVLVRRFYAAAGRDDADEERRAGADRAAVDDADERLATGLDRRPAEVRAARFDLHLFRPGEAPRDDRERAAMREASRVGHRFNDEFESVLSAAGYPVTVSWNPLEDSLASTDEGENVASAN